MGNPKAVKTPTPLCRAQQGMEADIDSVFAGTVLVLQDAVSCEVDYERRTLRGLLSKKYMYSAVQ